MTYGFYKAQRIMPQWQSSTTMLEKICDGTRSLPIVSSVAAFRRLFATN
jgi:hypothetical protein